MNLFRIFGFNEDKILQADHHTEGVVTDVKRCWWRRFKTNHARLYASDNNTAYAHIITFRYYVGDALYMGKRYIDIYYRTPDIGESFPVYYDPKKPEDYACYSFGPGPVLIGR